MENNTRAPAPTSEAVKSAAQKLNDLLAASHPQNGLHNSFVVAFGIDKITVMAPKKYDDIPDTFEGIPVEHVQSDCKFVAY